MRNGVIFLAILLLVADAQADSDFHLPERTALEPIVTAALHNGMRLQAERGFFSPSIQLTGKGIKGDIGSLDRVGKPPVRVKWGVTVSKLVKGVKGVKGGFKVLF